MKLVTHISELKKGDTLIVKDNSAFHDRGLSKVFGDIFSIDKKKTLITIKCKETESLEIINIDNGVIFLIS